MEKHVFEVSRYGTLYHRGKYVKETERMLTCENSRGQDRRMMKSANAIVIETDNPDEVVENYSVTWDSYKAEVDAAHDVYLAADRKRQDEAYKAITGRYFYKDAPGT